MLSGVEWDKIKQLRGLTGCCGKDCREALLECDYDVERAKIWLRKKYSGNFVSVNRIYKQ